MSVSDLKMTLPFKLIKNGELLWKTEIEPERNPYEDNLPPGQHTSAMASPEFMQLREFGQQNAPVSHALVPAGQLEAANDQPPCTAIVLSDSVMPD